MRKRLALAVLVLLLAFPSLASARTRKQRQARVLDAARSQVGTPYVWGAEAPGRGFDCSGLVQWAYRAVGKLLPRTTWRMLSRGMRVRSRARLQPGDLIFYEDGAHVALYLGHGRVIEAPHTGARIRIRPLGRYFQARRVLAH